MFFFTLWYTCHINFHLLEEEPSPIALWLDDTSSLNALPVTAPVV